MKYYFGSNINWESGLKISYQSFRFVIKSKSILLICEVNKIIIFSQEAAVYDIYLVGVVKGFQVLRLGDSLK